MCILFDTKDTVPRNYPQYNGVRKVTIERSGHPVFLFVVVQISGSCSSSLTPVVAVVLS